MTSSGPPTPATTPTPGLILSPPLPSAPLSTPIRPSPTMWFTSEIQQMMHGFGDCRKPLSESAAIIEELVRQQMATALYQSEDIARQRNARFIGIEDFLFLLRKDKMKLRRLLRYLELRDTRQYALKPAEDEDASEQAEPSKQPRKRRKICYDFLSVIDQTGEFLALFDETDVDEIKHERAMRAELQSQYMDVQQYLEYTEARQASFTPRFKSQRFKDWVLTGLTLDIKPNPLAVEVLGYLAYETVAQIVDLALLVKRDNGAEDPFHMAAPQACISHSVLPAFNGNPGPGSTAPGVVQTPAGTTTATTIKSPSGPASPLNSPPSTPTTPNPGSQTPLGLSSSGGAGVGSAKSKHKKKKKVGSADTPRNLLNHQPIHPGEIREAMRRYGAPPGPFAAFSKCPLLQKSSLLAL